MKPYWATLSLTQHFGHFLIKFHIKAFDSDQWLSAQSVLTVQLSHHIIFMPIKEKAQTCSYKHTDDFY